MKKKEEKKIEGLNIEGKKNLKVRKKKRGKKGVAKDRREKRIEGK